MKDDFVDVGAVADGKIAVLFEEFLQSFIHCSSLIWRHKTLSFSRFSF